MTAPPLIPVSWGELIDRITILEIKVERLSNVTARDNAAHELALLVAVAGQYQSQVGSLASQLKLINQTLWKTEDQIRDHERRKDFGPEFIALARAVYQTNDARSKLKREINSVLRSKLVEEKSYSAY